MRNEMHYVTVDNLEIVSDREVLFTISIVRHIHLTDPSVVERSMNQLMTAYPKVEMWHAHASNGILYIKVTGDFDRGVADEFVKHFNR